MENKVKEWKGAKKKKERKTQRGISTSKIKKEIWKK
jgi:hypothetical protein